MSFFKDLIGAFREVRKIEVDCETMKVLLKRMAFVYVPCRSEGGSIADAKKAVFHEFGVPSDFSVPTFMPYSCLAGDPLLTEWLAVREIANAVLVYHKVNPMPSGTLDEEKGLYLAQAIMWTTWHIHFYAIPEAERQGMTPSPVLREIGMRSEEIEAQYLRSLDPREPKNVMNYTKNAINHTMSEGMRWMVYGKDVIMPKTGKPMREFFESEEEARKVAIVVSTVKKGRLGLYACNEGTLESVELIAEYEDGDIVH